MAVLLYFLLLPTYLDSVGAELPAEEGVEEEDVAHHVDQVQQLDDQHLQSHKRFYRETTSYKSPIYMAESLNTLNAQKLCVLRLSTTYCAKTFSFSTLSLLSMMS